MKINGLRDFDDDPVTAYLQTLDLMLCELDIEDLVAAFHANMAKFASMRADLQPLPEWDQSDGVPGLEDDCS